MGTLILKNVTIRFGGLTAASSVDLHVADGKIVSVIGPNGAGKTTIFNSITGVYPPDEGSITFRERDVKEPFTFGKLLRACTTATAVGFGTVLLINCQTLWDAAIIQRFVYGEAFPWAGTLPAFWNALTGLPLSDTVVPFILAFLISALAVAVLWLRNRHTPLSASHQGIARTFQNIRIFPSLSVLENVLVGMHKHFRSGWTSIILGLPRVQKEEIQARERAREILSFVGLEEVAERAAAALSYGSQRRLEIARALAADPDLVLLDEPAAGMNPSEMQDLMLLIAKIRGQGRTVMLIEHHMKLVMSISDEVAVLHYGEKIAHGSPNEVQENPEVIKAYLGGEL